MTIPELYKIFLEHPVVVTDSRLISKDCIFWALKGENFNGNIFTEDALQKGAAIAIIDNENFYIPNKTILFKNTLKALQELAAYHRKILNLPVIALTGTNGKTTTKELITTVLSTQYNVKSTKGNLNNHIGVPLTLLTFDNNTEIGIVEMGANHPGEIEKLCNIVEPDFGLITNIGKAHLEGFGSFQGVIDTKSELYRKIKKKEGTIFYNIDNLILQNLDKGKKTIAYGVSENAYMKGKILSADPFVKIEIETFEGLKTEIETQLIGSYNFENILAAACIGDFFKINIQNIKKAVKNYTPDNNRSQLIKKENNTIILDAYNANPTSMKTALDNFLKLQKNNKVIIIGDMYELGKYSVEEHQNILDYICKSSVNFKELKEVIIIGRYFKEAVKKEHLLRNIRYFDTTEKAETFLRNNTYKNFTFLIKGSRAVKLEKLTNLIT